MFNESVDASWFVEMWFDPDDSITLAFGTVTLVDEERTASKHTKYGMYIIHVHLMDYSYNHRTWLLIRYSQSSQECVLEFKCCYQVVTKK